MIIKKEQKCSIPSAGGQWQHAISLPQHLRACLRFYPPPFSLPRVGVVMLHDDDAIQYKTDIVPSCNSNTELTE